MFHVVYSASKRRAISFSTVIEECLNYDQVYTNK